MAKTILIADDDPTQRRLLQAAVERQGFLTVQAEDGGRAIAASNNCDLVLLDLVMPGASGMDVLNAIKMNRPELPVIVLTGHGGVDTAVQAMQAGAVDFLIKPASPERIMVSVRNALKVTELQTEVKRLVKKQDGALGFEDMIAGAPAMRQVVRLGQRAAQSDIPVLILGESGVGKELIARSIQAASARAGKPFISVNCGAIPENLVESILFGHEKGSFTGAHEKHLGKFLEANGGTLFLDEVGELPLDMQVKLLRVLQEGEVDPIGSKRPVKVNVRIISATNKDLPALIEEGRFREDLYYRLNVFPIEAPPLRERREDIPALVSRFIARFNSEEGKSIEGASPQAMAMLCAFDWPGNVRQLKNVAEQLSVLEQKRLVSAESLQHYLPPDSPLNLPVVYNSEKSGSDEFLPERDILYKILFQLRSEMDEMKHKLVALEEHGPLPAREQGKMLPHPIHKPLEEEEEEVTEGEILPLEIVEESPDLSLDSLEKELIVKVLRKNKGHRKSTAKELGIAERTLYRKIKEYGIE